VPPRSAIVLVFDQLGASQLGPYGNTWIETPGFNRLAGQSCLFENLMGDSPRLESTYRSYWQGIHASCGDAAASADANLMKMASAAGIDTLLVSDEPAVLDYSLAADFACRETIPCPVPKAAATTVEQTHLFHFFEKMLEKLGDASEPFLFWAHSRGMSGPWDAPMEMRQQWHGEDDPKLPDLLVPPCEQLDEPISPDYRLGLSHSLAGQISLLDLCLEGFLAAIEEVPAASEALLIVTGPRGFALGEHGAVGKTGDQLYGESLHLPLLIRTPAGAGSLSRKQQLVQPADLFETLAEWFEMEPTAETYGSASLLPLVDGEDPDWRQVSQANDTSQIALRTPAWFYRHSSTDDEQLFLKPDDRWEVNEISALRPDVIEQMQTLNEQYQAAADQGTLDSLSPIPDGLLKTDE